MLRLLIYDRFDEMSSFYFDYCREEVKAISKCQNDYEKAKVALDNWEKDFPKVSDSDLVGNIHNFIDCEQHKLKHWVAATIFGTMCLEAFIYDYAAHDFSDTYVKKYLDKLELKAKWVIIPKLVTGKDFPTDSQAFQSLQKLVEERNKLIHHKSQPETPFPFLEAKLDKLLKDLERDKVDREELSKAFYEWQEQDSQRKEKYGDVSNLISFSPYKVIVDVLTELKRLDSNDEDSLWWELQENIKEQ